MCAVALFCYFEVRDIKLTDLSLGLLLIFVAGYSSRRQTGNAATSFWIGRDYELPLSPQVYG